MMETIMKKLSWYVFATMIMVALIFVFSFFREAKVEPIPLGGSAGEPYNATTTPQGTVFVDSLIWTGQGTFGGLVVTVAGTNTYDILNATTTDITKRTGNKATSTILMATIPASLAAGTYKFDSLFTTGLYLDYISGTTGSSTILWK